MLSAHGLTKRFGSLVAVDALDLTVSRGRVTGMLGPNGAGKTTTLRMLCGVLQPDAGTVEVDGVRMDVHPQQAKAAMGWLPDAAPAWGEMRVTQWIDLHATLHGHGADRMDTVLEACALQDVRHRLIGNLSRGFRQRVALAAALVHDPAVLVLDEPGTGLDPIQQQAFRALIATLAEDRAVLLSTHQLADAQAMCDDLVMIAAGRVVKAGPIGALQQAASTGTLILETRSDPTSHIASLDGVAAVDTSPLEDGWVQTRITPASSEADLREAIAAAVTHAGLDWRSLVRDEAPLDALVDAHLSEPAS
ncbi:MAG: ABC transporter ATP-binding protein [Phycisphaerales bacterium]|nr:ABC transporter ATP-binding protein [Phycisphaerales bacterium]